MRGHANRRRCLTGAPVCCGPAAESIRPGESDDADLSIKRASRRSEEALIRRALQKTRGNRTRAAELLEISHRALLYKIKEYAINVGRDTRELAAMVDGRGETPMPTTPSPVTPTPGPLLPFDSTWRAK